MLPTRDAGDAETLARRSGTAVRVPLGGGEDGGQPAIVDEGEKREDGLQAVGEEAVRPDARRRAGLGDGPAGDDGARVEGAETELGGGPDVAEGVGVEGPAEGVADGGGDGEGARYLLVYMRCCYTFENGRRLHPD